ncbi:DUF3883 domain-containing protein [Luteolibacter flavescens]|uniref:DUF3883 domain-containing protein n=1 Tax=Luteolibacter flavescens TaxID=1859460 RepID=A0ABT3FU26_9BACT|nr:DUF3883 domain-containing protein [Luteolibacter flavescens]MCW1886729.1 DUF3883 domain-containing protein [Luteolibacter flavescens]
MESFDFGQKQPIHIAIRQLIHDYPQDEGILKELIQNADDGGASEIRFILDRRASLNLEGPLPDWSNFAGAALIVTNDRPFDDDDLENIQHISDSDKISRPGQTGRYGRGFNAVYNLTDTPLLLTGSKLLLFDPCGFHVSKGESGKGWQLSDQAWFTSFPDALTIFEGGGYRTGSKFHEGSIFRFPLRQQLKGSNKKDRITDQKFAPETFSKLVDGLEKLADQILLYLRNIKFIGCYEIGPDGKNLSTLLEIATTNPDEVEAGRAPINSFVAESGGVDELLEAIAELDDGCHETVFRHEVAVRRKNQEDRLAWCVCSGVYAGDSGELVDCARRLNESGNKAVPFSGAAICLEKNGSRLPLVEGRVSCFLPLSGVLGGTGIRFSINGAFDLDGSRTGITKEREGSFGATTSRAEWNELLVTHAIAPALAMAMASVETPDVGSMNSLYRLFPLADATFLKPFEGLAASFLRLIADQSVFRIADGSCVPLEEVRLIDDDPQLHEALCLEGLPIPEPRLPDELVRSFEATGVELNELEDIDVYTAFICSEPVESLPEEFEKESLRAPERVAAVARFLVRKEWSDLRMLPLALCLDGYLRTFPSEENTDIFIGTDRHHRIFDWFPEWFLDPDFADASDIRHLDADGCKVMDVTDVLAGIPRVLFDKETGTSCWDPDGTESPNSDWLIDVMEELFDDTAYAKSEGGRRLLEKTPLIPADDGELHPPGFPSTPLLVANTEASLADLLGALGVRHFVLRPQSPLTRPLCRFRDEVGLVWPLSPCDLIDSLGDRLDDMPADASTWKSERTVSRLIEFLSKAELEADESRRKLREDVLRSLPIWKDASGTMGPLDARCYLQGRFTAPSLKSSVRIMVGGEQLVLLRKLGVAHISRWSLLSNHYLPEIGTFSPGDLFVIANWMRHEWAYLAEEHPGQEQGLLSALRDLQILLDEQDRPARPQDLYLPEAANLAKEVLGTNVRRPSPERYKDNPELWAEFFSRLGVLSSPSSQHLVDFIEQVSGAGEGQLPDPANQQSLTRILRHVRDHWDELHDDEVDTQEFGECPFHEFLAETHWVPAYREEDAADRFGAWQEPEARLFQPRELVPFALAARAASVRPIAPRNVAEFSAEAQELLGIVRLPQANEVCVHLRNVAARFGTGPLAPDSFERLSKVLQEVFRGLGALEIEAESEPDGARMRILVESCGELCDVACLPDQKLQCLRIPRDVYQGDAKGMSPVKATLVGKTDEIERGMKLLGRLDRPGIDDLADAMVRLRDRATPLSEVELKAVLACLRRLATLVAENPPTEPVIVALPNSEGLMLDPEDLLWVNDPVLGDQLSIAGDVRLHPDVPDSLLACIPVPSLNQAEAVVHGELVASSDPLLVKRCGEIGTLLRSPQFLDGLDRVLKTEQRLLSKVNLAWLEEVQVDACQWVECAYKVRMPSGRQLHIGTAKTEVAYVPMGAGGRFFVSESALHAELLEVHFAQELKRQLDSEAPRSDKGISAIQPMLGQSPESLALVLDKLRFLRLGDAEPEPEEEETDESSHYFGDEEHDPDGGMFTRGESDEDSEWEDEIEEDDEGEVPRDETIPGEEFAAGSTRGSGQNRRRSQSSRSGSGRTQTTSNGRRPGGEGGDTGETKVREHTRMIAGSSDTTTNAFAGNGNRRQQDGFLISRPKTEQQEEEERRRGDDHDDEHGHNVSLGKLAVGWVLQFELSQGRKPMSMAHANPGYDVESRRGRNPDPERYIEVKGINGDWGQNGVPLSSIQFDRARKEGDKFWLYVVENAGDPEKVRIHMIQNPAGKATQFRFDHGWRQAGQTAAGFKARVPKKAQRLRTILDETGYEEGEIQRVDQSGNTWMLAVKYDSGPAKTVVYDPTRHVVVE